MLKNVVISSISLVYSHPALSQRLNNQLLIVLKRHLTILIKVGHLHPALGIFLSGVVVHAHHRVCLAQKVRDLALREVPTFVLVELVEQPFGYLQALLDFLCVVAGLVFH